MTTRNPRLYAQTDEERFAVARSLLHAAEMMGVLEELVHLLDDEDEHWQ